MCKVKTCTPFDVTPIPNHTRWACLMACGATKYVDRPRGMPFPRSLLECCETPVEGLPEPSLVLEPEPEPEVELEPEVKVPKRVEPELGDLLPEGFLLD